MDPNVNKFQKNNQKGAFEADFYIRIALQEVRDTLTQQLTPHNSYRLSGQRHGSPSAVRTLCWSHLREVPTETILSKG